MNLIGLTAAISTFLGVWFGHVAVRKIEFSSLTIWLPAAVFIIVGAGFELLSLTVADIYLSIAFGVFGITVLWDAFEFSRQQNRIKKGHAPANPDNPRHAKILAGFPSATPFDMLRRQPVGRPVSADEAISLINH